MFQLRALSWLHRARFLSDRRSALATMSFGAESGLCSVALFTGADLVGEAGERHSSSVVLTRVA